MYDMIDLRHLRREGIFPKLLDNQNAALLR
jgi:hypothetical protein